MLKLSNGWTDWHQIWHTCADSSGNGYTPNKLPSETQGGTWGFRGSNPQVWRSCQTAGPISTVVHVCGFICEWTYGKYKSPHNTPGGIFGDFRGSQIQMSVEAVKRLNRLAPTFGTCLRIRLGMDIARYNSPLNSTGGIWGVLGGNKLKSVKAAKRMDRLAPNSEHVCGFIWQGHRLKTIRPTIPNGGILGGFSGSTIQKPGEFGQTAGSIGNTFCTYNACGCGNGHRLNKLAT